MIRPTAADVAAMPQIADATLARTFHWSLPPEEGLYRDCPTAFWLAPEADSLLPAPNFTLEPQVAQAEPTAPDAATATATGFLAAIGFAMMVAGPSFLSTLSLTTDGVGTPLARIASGVGLALVSAPLSIPFGAIPAAAPVIIGVGLLTWLGMSRPIARLRRLWAATGAGMGLMIAAAFDAGMTTVPIVLTSIACACVAHRAIDWTEA
ncbi:hypothetical protein ASE86_08500 [Sphingomonas sp. Leaf33]|uniref:hypothetical protein n=1 Tax=Sphingomonas sp. Leaf33 TaxID=1736215 RepID=UPI0006FDA0FD|nr:hypothetical protein [Sphingomonas sp. Leaf33]KQN26180.1 hypothetical protein ASE86_08500 [Sphingomonas sp. Leaf33]